MVNILIPTDFSQASFVMAESAVKTLNKKVNIILFHAYEMPTGIHDLIRGSLPYTGLMNDAFRNNCRYLKYKYPDLINKICFKYLQGCTTALFKNFAQANEIDLIVCPDGYAYKKVHATSINPVTFFKKSSIQLLKTFAPIVTGKKEQEIEAPFIMEELQLETA